MNERERQKQVEEQTIRAGAYYKRHLEHFGKEVICARVDGTMIVVARGEYGDKLATWAGREGLNVNEPKEVKP